MMARKLFAIILVLILAAMLFCGCDSYADPYTTESIAYVVGTVPEGYLETLTSLEGRD